jgi:hypothetical protein
MTEGSLPSPSGLSPNPASPHLPDDQGRADTPAEQRRGGHGGAWEIHKDADSLLHSRVNSFFIAQTFFVPGFVLAFNSTSFGSSIVAVLISVIAIVICVETYRLNKSLIKGITMLKNKLSDENPVYKEYIQTCREGIGQSFLPCRLPVYLAVFWLVMVMVLVVYNP